MIPRIGLASIAILVLSAACTSASPGDSSTAPEAVAMPAASSTQSKREFNPTLAGTWIGNGISYSPYRDGEGPGKGTTAKENILEDMQIIAKRWNLIRLYGADEQSRDILEVIRDNKLPIRVMQGIWLDKHQTEQENNEQLRLGIEFANQFPEIIIAVNVGNEIFVDWSYHRLDDMDKVIGQIREVRAKIKQPVTVSDDYNFWNKEPAQKVAAEIDFICLHAYAFWNNKTLDVAQSWTESTYRDIQKIHPDHLIAYCETGWPTNRIYGDGSYEGGLVGKAGETQQETFFDQYNAWIDQTKIISFYFSSFDEQWKGGFDGENPMDKAEKHWGLYKSDRTPKQALR